MIFNFVKYLTEAKYDAYSEKLAHKLISHIKRNSTKQYFANEFQMSSITDYTLTLLVIQNESFDNAIKDTDFVNLPWEKINFIKNGFVVDANSYILTYEDMYNIPEVEITIIINPKLRSTIYKALYIKLLDIIRHELEHLLQKGLNAEQTHKIKNMSDKKRQKYQNSYKYYLLPDEIPAAVSGMRLSAKHRGVPIDVEFLDYLEPIVKSGYITIAQRDKVVKKWVQYALKHYPNTILSKKY